MNAKLLPYLTPTERGWLALAEAATPGSWEPTMYSNDPTWSPVIKSAKSGLHLAYFPVRDGVREDAAFIAAARTALPAVLEALALARRDAANEAQARRDAERDAIARFEAYRDDPRGPK